MRVLLHASEVLTGSGFRRKDGRKVTEDDIDRIEDGAIAYSNKVLWVGKTSDLPKRYLRAKRINLKNLNSVTAGFVDCHTHLIFSGDRSDEFAERCAGATYEQIAVKGGGILKTVQTTREASLIDLEKLAISRLKEAMAQGVRAIEIKSGYGLSHEAELKCLEVIKRLKKRYPQIAIQATYLGAHAFPKDCSREAYIDEIVSKTLPVIAKKELADACDVFIDRGYYTPNEGRRILEKAKALGLKIKVHADELSDTESASLAAQLGALSADHLLQINSEGISQLARSNTVAVLLPGTAFYLKAPYAPARKLIDAGACVAIASDFNPGSCPWNSLPAMMTLAALQMGMARAEILCAVTYAGAKALGMADRMGTLEPGRDARFTILPFKKFEECYYRLGWVASR